MTYLSGPITNMDPEIQAKNMARFFELSTVFTGCYNPAEHEARMPNGTYEQYLALDVVFILQNKPSMFMIKGWETSRGVRLEHEIAKLLNLKITYEGV